MVSPISSNQNTSSTKLWQPCEYLKIIIISLPEKEKKNQVKSYFAVSVSVLWLFPPLQKRTSAVTNVITQLTVWPKFSLCNSRLCWIIELKTNYYKIICNTAVSSWTPGWEPRMSRLSQANLQCKRTGACQGEVCPIQKEEYLKNSLKNVLLVNFSIDIS